MTTAFPHRLAVIRRTESGDDPDDYNHVGSTESAIAIVRGSVQPKSVREVAQLNQAGAVVSDHTVYLQPADVKAADVLRFEPDDGRRFEIIGVRDEAGRGHHLAVDARMVTA